MKLPEIKICVVGLGYVGLPLATLLSKKFSASGFDINEKKIEALKKGIDETGEVENLSQYTINYSADPAVISESNFIIIAVPTLITANQEPDLAPPQSASETLGEQLTRE